MAIEWREGAQRALGSGPRQGRPGLLLASGWGPGGGGSKALHGPGGVAHIRAELGLCKRRAGKLYEVVPSPPLDPLPLDEASTISRSATRAVPGERLCGDGCCDCAHTGTAPLTVGDRGSGGEARPLDGSSSRRPRVPSTACLGSVLGMPVWGQQAALLPRPSRDCTPSRRALGRVNTLSLSLARSLARSHSPPPPRRRLSLPPSLLPSPHDPSRFTEPAAPA
jgi:hypothetical protein